MAKKKKLSAYNRHVQREMNAGATMKQAARSWKSPSKSKTKRKKSRGARKAQKSRIAARRPKSKIGRKVGRRDMVAKVVKRLGQAALAGGGIVAVREVMTRLIPYLKAKWPTIKWEAISGDLVALGLLVGGVYAAKRIKLLDANKAGYVLAGGGALLLATLFKQHVSPKIQDVLRPQIAAPAASGATAGVGRVVDDLAGVGRGTWGRNRRWA